MTVEQMIAAAAAVGLVVGAAAFWLMLRVIRKSIAQAPPSALTPEQLHDVTDMTRQLQRLIDDIDAKISSHLSRLDQAMLQADAKADLLRQASQPRATELPSSIEAEAAGHPIWSPSTTDGPPRAIAPEEDPAEDEPVTLPGTWPIPPSRPETNDQPQPRRPAQLQSPRHVEVLRLHRQGETAQTIARKLRMDLGEVELVLRLHGAARTK